jgi:hypothetical protein
MGQRTAKELRMNDPSQILALHPIVTQRAHEIAAQTKQPVTIQFESSGATLYHGAHNLKRSIIINPQ